MPKELVDEAVRWRIVYRIDSEEIVVVAMFEKDSRKTPAAVIEVCKARLRRWDAQDE